MRGKHRLGGMRLERVYNLLRTESSEAVLPFIETIIDASNNMALQTPLAEVRPRPTLKAAVFVKVPVGELDAEYRLLPIAPPRGDLDPIAYARVLIKRIQTRVAKCVAFCVPARALWSLLPLPRLTCVRFPSQVCCAGCRCVHAATCDSASGGGARSRCEYRLRHH